MMVSEFVCCFLLQVVNVFFLEYMLGDTILVAPVIVKGATSRNVYLPAGRWMDGNNGNIIEGPKSFIYNAPIDVLPYFFKQ